MKKILTAAVAAMVAAAVATVCFATAASDDVDTPERAGNFVTLTQASNVVYAGTMICEDGSAAAAPASDTSGYIVVGRAETGSDNTGANYSATKTLTAKRGVFRWANGGSFTDANIGDLAYVSDDNTVTGAGSVTYDVVAGVIVDVDSDGVWVDSYAIGGQGAASVAALTASGAANLQSTLAVGGNATFGGTVTLGDNGDTVAINSSDWDITTAGVASGLGTIGCDGDITLTDAANAAGISAIAASGSYDATLTLDADAGEDNGDTWIIESEAADNDLSFVNHTTEAVKISTAGVLTATDDIVCDKIIFTDSLVSTATNAVKAAFLVTINGTNYYFAVYPVND